MIDTKSRNYQISFSLCNFQIVGLIFKLSFLLTLIALKLCVFVCVCRGGGGGGLAW